MNSFFFSLILKNLIDSAITSSYGKKFQILRQSPPLKLKHYTVPVLQGFVNNSSAPVMLKLHSSFPLVFCSKWVIPAMPVLKDSCFPFPSHYSTWDERTRPAHNFQDLGTPKMCTIAKYRVDILCLVLDHLPDNAQHFNSFWGWCCYALGWWYQRIVDDDSKTFTSAALLKFTLNSPRVKCMR